MLLNHKIALVEFALIFSLLYWMGFVLMDFRKVFHRMQSAALDKKKKKNLEEVRHQS